MANVLRVTDNKSSRTRRSKSSHLSDVAIGIGLTAIAVWVYWVGNTSLMFSHGDATWIHDMHNEKLAAHALFGESLRDFRSGLGVWLAPTVAALDLPVLLSMVVSGRSNEVIFGAVSVAGLYFAGWLLSRQFSPSRSIAQFSGVAYAFAVFMPTPFMWTRVIYQSSFTWTLIASTVSVALLIQTITNESCRGNKLPSVGVVLGLTSAIGAWGLWVYPVAMFWCLFGLAIFLTSTIPKQLRKGVYLTWSMGALPLLWVLISMTLLIRATASIAARDIAVGSVVDLENPKIWFFDDVYPVMVPGTSVNLYGALILVLVLAGTASTLTSQSPSLRLLGRIICIASLIFFGYAVLHYAFRLRGIEVGPSPGYIVLFLFPFWIVAIATMIPRHIGWFRDISQCVPRQSVESQSSHTKTNSWPRLTLVLGGLLVLWSIVWSVDNWHLRTGPRYFPVPISETVLELSNRLRLENSASFAGRVMILQTPGANRDGVKNAILYPTAETKRLRRELVEARVPTISTYSHLASPQYMRAMSAWFAGGKRYVRLWSVFEELDVDIARLLGVRFVVSERPLVDADMVTYLKHSDRGYVYEITDPNLGNFSPTRVRVVQSESQALELVSAERFDVRRDVIVSRDLGDLTPVSSSSFSASRGVITISVMTSGQSLVVLPIEYSSCMSVISADGPAEVLRVNNLLTGVLVSRSGQYVVDVRNYPYLLSRCN